MIGNVIERLMRQLGGVKLMAVSKTRTLDEIKEAYACGQTLFGENHVQEMEAKFDPQKDSFASLVQCEMIGHLQSNKVKRAVALASRIDSVDSLELARKIDGEAQRQGKVMRILLELNCSGEVSKTGFASEEEAERAIAEIVRMPGLKLEGFMTMGPVLCTIGTPEWTAMTHQAFSRLRAFRNDMQARYPHMELYELSMGMTNDWKIAVAEGSTMVRIGTMIFGERDNGN